jgi:hypothetical protein
MMPRAADLPAGPLREERLPVVLPCAESCAAFRPLAPAGWPDFGLCTNPRSPRCGYPVRPGRDCRSFLTIPSPVSTAG